MSTVGRAYVVRDADSGPGEVTQVYPYTLKGLTAALEDARFGSFRGVPQVVAVMRDGRSTVIRRFEHGREAPLAPLQPVALMLIAILHFIADSDDPAGIVATLLAALPTGSYLVASHISPDHDPAGVEGAQRTYRARGVTAQPRTAEQFGRVFFGGLDLVPPGVTLVSEWRPDEGDLRPKPGEVNSYGAVGRKPGAAS